MAEETPGVVYGASEKNGASWIDGRVVIVFFLSELKGSSPLVQPHVEWWDSGQFPSHISKNPPLLAPTGRSWMCLIHSCIKTLV